MYKICTLYYDTEKPAVGHVQNPAPWQSVDFFQTFLLASASQVTNLYFQCVYSFKLVVLNT